MAITAEMREANHDDALHISMNARPDDISEIWASHNMRPLHAIEFGMNHGVAFTGLADGEPVVVWGVIRQSYVPNMGIPWMIASAALDRNDVAIAFLRRCREPLLEFLSEYDMLVNYVDTKNVRAIKWLKYMGFAVEDTPKPYGALKLPFHRFEMRSSCVPQ